jgi:hypothetical protein
MRKAAFGDAFAKVAVEPGPDTDELTQAEITEVVKSHKAQTDACAESSRAAMADTPNGSLTVKWNVETTGRVNGARPVGELADTPFAECLVKEISSWTFPKHETPHPPVDATFKF